MFLIFEIRRFLKLCGVPRSFSIASRGSQDLSNAIVRKIIAMIKVVTMITIVMISKVLTATNSGCVQLTPTPITLKVEECE